MIGKHLQLPVGIMLDKFCIFPLLSILMNAFPGCCEHFVLRFLTLSLQVCPKLGRELGGTFVLLRSMFSWSTVSETGLQGPKHTDCCELGRTTRLWPTVFSTARDSQDCTAPASLCYLLLGEQESVAGWVRKGTVEDTRQITLFHF